jgi:pimeloyl-ACP methyl ester carboxylesterase
MVDVLSRQSARLVLGLLVPAALLLAGCQTARTAPWPTPPGTKTLWLDDYPMTYAEKGTGPAIVLVHGQNSDYRFWEANLDPLSEHLRVVAPSLRHFYPEPWDGKGTFSAREHADDLIAFVERLGARPVTVVGHSRGGLVVADAAVRRPDLFRKVVLAEPVITFAPPPPLSDDTPFNRFQRDVNARFERDGPEAGLAQWHEVFGKGTWQRLQPAERERRLQNAWTVTRLNDIGVPCEQLRTLPMPVLLVRGADSPPMFGNMLAAVGKCIPSARTVTIPNAAHPMNRQNPAAFDAALLEFDSR